jgi:hypothetical protein
LKWLQEGFAGAYNYVKEVLIGFWSWYAEGWLDTNKSIGRVFQDFINDLVGNIAGAKAYIQALEDAIISGTIAAFLNENKLDSFIAAFKARMKDAGGEWAEAFVKGWEKSEAVIESLKKKLREAWDTMVAVLGPVFENAELVLSNFIDTQEQMLKDLLDAVITQFGADAEFLIGKIKGMMEDLKSLSKEMGLPTIEDLEGKYKDALDELERMKNEMRGRMAGTEQKRLGSVGIREAWMSMAQSINRGVQQKMLAELKDINEGIEENTEAVKNQSGPVRETP